MQIVCHMFSAAAADVREIELILTTRFIFIKIYHSLCSL